MYGHTARIWKVIGINDSLIATVSEDATCRIWDTVKNEEVS